MIDTDRVLHADQIHSYMTQSSCKYYRSLFHYDTNRARRDDFDVAVRVEHLQSSQNRKQTVGNTAQETRDERRELPRGQRTKSVTRFQA